MSAPLFTILLPHLRETANDAALKIALDTLVTHTVLNFELLVESVAERRDIYAVINGMAERAKTDWLIPWNSDVFASPGWAEPLWEARDEQTIVSPVMVEPGAIGVHPRNHQQNFGMTPERYRRADFEQFARDGGHWSINWIDGEWAWFFPSLIPRARFEMLGGFDTSKGVFPAELDVDFWTRWQESGGKFKRVRSWVYHLQQWSFVEEQAKAARYS